MTSTFRSTLPRLSLGSLSALAALTIDPFILSDGTEVFHSSPGFRGSLGLLYFF